ncbi:MAG: hypothetical protein JOZ22_14220 [Acidobacteriia bacterium]|nr:hypothetical protein [Terriglobia bacterium]
MKKMLRSCFVICALFGVANMAKAISWPIPDDDDGDGAVAVVAINSISWPIPDDDDDSDGAVTLVAFHSASAPSTIEAANAVR